MSFYTETIAHDPRFHTTQSVQYSLEPRPSFSSPDVFDAERCDVENLRQLMVEHLSPADDLNVLRLKFSYRSVLALILRVLLGSFPIQVCRIAASEMTVTTRVRRLMLRGWRFAIAMSARQTANESVLSLKPEMPISSASRGVGPNKTVRTRIGEHDRVHILKRFAPLSRLFFSHAISFTSGWLGGRVERYNAPRPSHFIPSGARCNA